MKYFFYAFVIFLATILFAGCNTTESVQEAQKVPENSTQQLIREGKNEEAANRFRYQYGIDAIDESGNTALHVAAELNEYDLVSHFISVGANTEIKNNAGDTALHVAINNGSYESAQILANFGKNLFLRNNSGESALGAGLRADDAYYDIFITPTTGEKSDERGRNIVHYLAQESNERAIRKCIENNIPISVRDKDGYTPLDIAFETTHTSDSAVQIAAELIMAGATTVTPEYTYFQTAVKNRNLDNRLKDGQTPLHQATINGHTNIVRYLLRNGASTKNQDAIGATPLHEAVRYGRLEIARMLLANGAPVNAEDNLRKTPIMIIISENNQEDMYTLLISYNADLKHKDTYGDTVLHTAEMANIPLNIIRSLVNAGAAINERNKEGITPVSIAIEAGLKDHINYYANNGADIHSADKSGNTPLTRALKAEGILEYLVNHTNAVSRDSKGNTPLHIAILNNAPFDKTKYIMDLMPDVNTRNADGNSALYLAVAQNKKDIGELLLARNADIFSLNNQDYSPLRLALQNKNPAADWLITSETIKTTDGFGNTPLHYAAEWEMAEAAVTLITRGADTSARNGNGETPMFNAIKSNNIVLLNQLLVGGNTIFTRDNMGNTPLHAAVRWNSPQSALHLINYGVDIDAQNLSGKTALSEAVLLGNTDIAFMLLKNGANVNLTDNSGRTILMDSIKSDSPETVHLLLMFGANPHIKEMHGRTAYHEAALSGNTEIISLIGNAGGNPLMRDKNGNSPFILSLDKEEDVILEVLGNDKMIADSDGNTPAHIAINNKISIDVLKMLIQNGYQIDTKNALGDTPLSLAVKGKDSKSATVLLANGANTFTSIDKNGQTAASIALANNDTAILQEMAKFAGTKTDIQGNTLLHLAATISPIDTIQMLLANGMNTKAKNMLGETPRETAIRWNRNDIADILQ